MVKKFILETRNGTDSCRSSKRWKNHSRELYSCLLIKNYFNSFPKKNNNYFFIPNSMEILKKILYQQSDLTSEKSRKEMSTLKCGTLEVPLLIIPKPQNQILH